VSSPDTVYVPAPKAPVPDVSEAVVAVNVPLLMVMTTPPSGLPAASRTAPAIDPWPPTSVADTPVSCWPPASARATVELENPSSSNVRTYVRGVGRFSTRNAPMSPVVGVVEICSMLPPRAIPTAQPRPHRC